jgi:selenocysteine lyase/cysteine desulfurase
MLGHELRSLSRGAFVQSLASLAAAPSVASALTAAALPTAPAGTAEDVSRDETYWSAVRAAYDRDPDVVQLWHGPGGAVPRAIVDAANALTTGEAREMGLLAAFDDLEESGSSRLLRDRLAATFGCVSDEIALTRNAMEGLATALLGVDLRRGDEIVSTVFDYDSCLAILRQRAAREGVRLKLASFPAAARESREIVDAIEAQITSRTKLLLACHILTHTGEVLPIREIAAMARRRGVFFVVDGAHGPGHLPLRLSEYGCDAYAGSLHKWFPRRAARACSTFGASVLPMCGRSSRRTTHHRVRASGSSKKSAR